MSKIIKSQESNGNKNLEPFLLRTIGLDGVAPLPVVETDGFIPTEIAPQTLECTDFVATPFFENSEAKSGNLPEVVEVEAEAEEPSGIFLTEEELDKRLRESYESGLKDGKDLAERGLLNVFNSLRSASEGLHAMWERVLRESEDELLKLIIIVARKIILREATLDRHILQDVIKAATAKLSERDEIVIRLNPDDYAMVTTHGEGYFRDERATERMRFKADPVLPSGSCKVETEMGTIDAGFDAQLDEIYRRLLEERGTSLEAGA